MRAGQLDEGIALLERARKADIADTTQRIDLLRLLGSALSQRALLRHDPGDRPTR